MAKKKPRAGKGMHNPDGSVMTFRQIQNTVRTDYSTRAVGAPVGAMAGLS